MSAPIPQILLAAQPQQPQSVAPFILLIIVMIFVTMLLGAVILVLRRRMFERGSDAAHAGSLLGQLRRMRDAGDISDAEYDTARRSLSVHIAASTPDPSRPVRTPRLGRTGPSTPRSPGAPPGYDAPPDRLPDQPTSE